MKRYLKACALQALALFAVASLSVPGALAKQPLDVAALQGVHNVTARVTGVHDGDTVYLQLGAQSVRVRLAEIDAPEVGQAYGRRSEQALRDMVAKREVVASWSQLDRHQRPIVRLHVDGKDVNAEMVRQGMAWAYVRYLSDRRFIAMETEARSAGRGLWADPHPVAPWDWRKQKASGSLEPE
ncbi:thermonuclease family protein (plasmid) [Sphaerotilaceae bacterium SBD11-9]